MASVVAPSRAWATLMLVALSLHVPQFGLVPIGAVLALWRWGAAREAVRTSGFRAARWLVPGAAVAIVVGLLLRLALASSFTGTLSSVRTAVEVVVWIAAFPLMATGGFLAITVLGVRASALWLSLGALIGGVTYIGFGDGNPWKYVLAYPAALLLLYLTSKSAGRLPALGACVLLILISVSYDTRNVAGAAAITAVLVLMFSMNPSNARPGPRLAVVAGVTAAGVALLLESMRRGWLGHRLAEQYAAQTAGGQTVFFGGRVEWNVTATLFKARPAGFGLGTKPGGSLQADSISAVAHAGGDPNRYYYNFAVFGDRVDVHSIVGDLWFHAGLGGVALAAVMLAVLVSGAVSASLAASWTPGAKAVVYFAIAQACWDLLFSPMAQIDHVTIGLAVAMSAVAAGRMRLAAPPTVTQPITTKAN